MRLTALPFLLLCACPPSEPTSATTKDDADSDTDSDSDADADADSDSDSDADTDTGAAGCDPVSSGTDWAWTGECPGMDTPCEIVVSGCEMSIDYSSGMSMGMPIAGLVAGSEVTFTGGTVPGCVGTVIDPDTIEGSCGDGCTYTLSR